MGRRGEGFAGRALVVEAWSGVLRGQLAREEQRIQPVLPVRGTEQFTAMILLRKNETESPISFRPSQCLDF